MSVNMIIWLCCTDNEYEIHILLATLIRVGRYVGIFLFKCTSLTEDTILIALDIK